MRSAAKTMYILIAVVFLGGCLVVHPRHAYPRPVPPGHGYPPARVRRARHVHGRNCGHVYRHGRWVSVKLEVKG